MCGGGTAPWCEMRILKTGVKVNLGSVVSFHSTAACHAAQRGRVNINKRVCDFKLLKVQRKQRVFT